MPYGSNFPSLSFRTTGAWGPGNGLGAGGRLTNTQADENIDELGRAVEELRDNPPSPDDIATVLDLNGSFKFVLGSGAELGPVTIPTSRMSWQGEWAAATGYVADDVVTVSGDGIYLVLQDHTSAASFDAEASDSDGAVYSQMFGLGIPGVETISATTETAALADNNKYFLATNSAGCTVTVPKDVDVAFPLGAVLTYEQRGADPVDIVGDSDSDGSVTVNCPASKLPQSAELYAQIAVVKTATDTWTVSGYLAEAGSA
jgi:hypothetical protein